MDLSVRYFWRSIFFTLWFGIAFAINPINITLIPRTGLPQTTFMGTNYIAAYTFTNNLPIPKRIKLLPSMTGSGFSYDGFCNNITLSPQGQKGSSCTTYIQFHPSAIGFAQFELTLQYDKNVIHLTPPFINNLTTTSVQLCGTTPYPSNTGYVVPAPTINSNQVWSFVSAPELHPMKVSVIPYTLSQLAAGYIMNAPYALSSESTYGQTGALTADNDGNPIWFRPLNNVSLMNADFRIQFF